jgi:hypothetical protein
VIDVPGWVMMVTGKSVVLYSRLHLVIENPKILRAVLIMIVVDGVVFHTTMTVVRFGAYDGGDQMTGFYVQESIISAIYLY